MTHELEIVTAKGVVNFENLFNFTNDKNPLKIAFLKQSMYWVDFFRTFDLLTKKISFSKRQIKEILHDKLQIARESFDEDIYYQAATEYSVIFHMACYKHTEFDYEKKINSKDKSKKNPECSLKTTSGSIFTVEGKCPKREVVPSTSLEGKRIYLVSVGRAPSKEAFNEQYQQLKSDIESANPNVILETKKNNDNKMKDYLLSASNKFHKIFDEKELNILFLALNDVFEIQEYYGYLYFNGGLFTKTSFEVTDKYKNVDIVIFTNSYFRHKNNEEINGSAWLLNDGFNLVMMNPHSEVEKKRDAVKEFLADFRNFSSDLINYKVPAAQGTPQDVLESLIIPSYVKYELEKNKNIFLFKKKISNENNAINNT